MNQPECQNSIFKICLIDLMPQNSQGIGIPILQFLKCHTNLMNDKLTGYLILTLESVKEVHPPRNYIMLWQNKKFAFFGNKPVKDCK